MDKFNKAERSELSDALHEFSFANDEPRTNPIDYYTNKVVDAIDAYIDSKLREFKNVLEKLGHTDECYSGEMDQCDCPLSVLNKL